MPQITVDYSGLLGAAFDRPAFALALHPIVVDNVDARPGGAAARQPASRTPDRR